MRSQPGFMVSGRPGLIDIIRKLGLTGGLSVCLDAGDSNSTDGSSQTWTDLSGNGNHYFRGANNTVTTDDPTFNGSAGALTSSEYWSFDGGDRFTETASQTYADSWLADGAKFSIFSTIFMPAAGFSTDRSFYVNGTMAGGTVRVGIGGSEVPYFGDISLAQWSVISGVALTTNAWNFMGFSADENGGASGSFIRNNTTVTTGNGGPVTAPATSSTAYTIGGDNTGDNVESGTRVSMFAAWNGVNLSQAQMAALYSAIKTLRHSTLP